MILPVVDAVIQDVMKVVIPKDSNIPVNALLSEDGFALLAEDGTILLAEGT